MKLDVIDLQFAYRRNHAVLRGVSFQAEEGACICVLGRNGSGKTTLFRCLLGLLDHYRGDIFIDGQNTKSLSIQDRAKKISYIPQAHAPIFNFTVNQTVLMGTNPHMTFFSMPGEKQQARVTNVLQQLGIEHLAERGYAELSGGERQMVLIARALVQDADILIMDEPTANLDYGNQFHILKQIRALSEAGYLVLLSTHNPEHSLYVSDQVLVLQDGKITHYGPTGKILNRSVVESIYGIPVTLHHLETESGSVPVVVPFP